MSVAPGNETTAAAAQFFPGATIEPVAGRSWLVSATTDDDKFSVRQLDQSLPATRVDLIHEFLAQEALECATALVATDRATALSFDARRWREGSPIGRVVTRENWHSLHLPASIELDALGSIAHSLGVFHRTGSTSSIVARAPHYRVKETLTGVRRSLEMDERALAGEIRKESRARRWLTASRPLLANAETNLEQVTFLRDEPLVIAHLDLWGSHIVRNPEEESAFLDCAKISSAPAVIDLAQLIARNGEWSDERVERVLTGYAESAPIQPLQRRLLPWLVALDAISNCGHLLVSAHDERRPLSDSERRDALAGADQQLELLQALVNAFVPAPPRKYRRQGPRPDRSASKDR